MDVFQAVKPISEGGLARAHWTTAVDGEAGEYPEIARTLGPYSFTVWLGDADDPCDAPTMDMPTYVPIRWGNVNDPDAAESVWKHWGEYEWAFFFADAPTAIRFTEQLLDYANTALKYSGAEFAHPQDMTGPNIYWMVERFIKDRTDIVHHYFEVSNGEPGQCGNHRTHSAYLMKARAI